MKPVAIVALVVSTSLLAFFVGRMSVTSSCPSHAAAAPVAMPAMPAMPAAEPAADTHEKAPALVGKVLEIIQVPGYTYLRFEMPGGDRWAAVSSVTTVKVGDTIKLGDAMVMHGFASPTLKRTFETIYFAQLL